MNRNLIRLCLGAMMGVLLTVGKEVMAFLPNFEPVTLLTVLFTLCFGGLALGPWRCSCFWRGCCTALARGG